MKKLTLLFAGILALGLVGCGAKDETVDVPKSATEGGNVVKTPPGMDTGATAPSGGGTPPPSSGLSGK